MSARASIDRTLLPKVIMPATDDRPVEEAPYVLTETDVIRLTRLDESSAKDPSRTLAYYRDKGLLRGTQIGRELRYQLPDVIDFLEQLKTWNPR